jgi:hypothetical protein
LVCPGWEGEGVALQGNELALGTSFRGIMPQEE